MINIIVADDDRTSKEIIAGMLKKELPQIDEVYTAKNGREILDIFTEHRIDIIISDIRMPVMDGIEMSRRVRKLNKDVCIILVSAYTEFEYAKQALRYNVQDYIVKPLDRKEFENLKSIIIQHIKNKQKNIDFQINFHKSNISARTKEALLKGSSEDIFKMLDELNFSEIDDIKLIQEPLFAVVDGVFSYMEGIGFKSELKTKEKVIHKIIQCQEIEDCIMVVGEIIADVTQFEKNIDIDRIVEAVKSMIDGCYTKEGNEDYCVNEFADRFNVSRVYMTIAFKKKFGVSIKEYSISKKMNYAIHLLKNTDSSVLDIAKALGYSSDVGFRKIFKKYYNMTPNQYRDSEKKDDDESI